jgi:hypothetical protein
MAVLSATDDYNDLFNLFHDVSYRGNMTVVEGLEPANEKPTLNH